ncbi:MULTISPECIES: enoyl-CoA hydratase/isomerase family protein [unclassified Caballeronia]|uniref:enoyl-CoA hydratase/isomerase family protein n=1 Tax=unclassified Caballeronia TaxID=2646786 RepID=UPI0028668222|nr:MULTISPECIES: enoyl-CoA hydratase/isomerase family protein [unclassified Caballeronia]MDR5777162.1 enoyl-CoA hydratase/isomerase family protein [Caballeronia sp. LZ002]MDR5852613.1 enoyl-CoA hydratase/isomerase family protein [Caballeronia sp. LZ003]
MKNSPDAVPVDDMAPVVVDGNVALITLTFPRRRNALCAQMRAQLRQRLEALNAQASVRAIVLRGAEGHFCSGGDITEMRTRTVLEARQGFELATSIARLIATGPKPVVVAVEGVAVGAGLSIAALADYVIATPDARFAASFARMGLLADLGGMWGLVQRVGAAKARELLGLSRTLSGAEALQIGLVNEVAEASQIESRASDIAREYAAMPPMAMAFLRAAFARGMTAIDQVTTAEMDLATVLSCSEDHQEAVRAFVEKREPKFHGR